MQDGTFIVDVYLNIKRENEEVELYLMELI